MNCIDELKQQTYPEVNAVDKNIQCRENDKKKYHDILQKFWKCIYEAKGGSSCSFDVDQKEYDENYSAYHFCRNYLQAKRGYVVEFQPYSDRSKMIIRVKWEI